MKLISRLLYGFIMGVVLHVLVTSNRGSSYRNREVMGWMMLASLTIGHLLSRQVRCYTTLLLPMFLGKAAKSYIHAMIYLLILQGPVENIVTNLNEVVAAMDCGAELSFNMSVLKLELMVNPVKDAVLSLFTDNQLETTVADVQTSFNPIKVENECRTGKECSMDDSKQMNNFSFGCQDIFNKGLERCRKTFADIRDQCLEKLPIIGSVVCAPLQFDVLCVVSTYISGRSVCGSDSSVDSNVSVLYTKAQAAMDDLEGALAVNFTAQVSEDEPINVTTVPDVKVRIKKGVKDVRQYRNVSQKLIEFLKFLLIFRVVVMTYCYHYNYVMTISWDNNYVTSYFRAIDSKRKLKGKGSLIPLKDYEKDSTKRPWAPSLNAEELKKFFGSSAMLIFEMLFVASIILFNHLFTTMLQNIRKFGQINFQQSGSHRIDVEVGGSGAVANLVRSIVMGFNQNQLLEKLTTNHVCLPRAHDVGTETIYWIYGAYVVLLVISYILAYVLRLRRFVCALYYPKQEKERISHLFKNMANARKSHLPSEELENVENLQEIESSNSEELGSLENLLEIESSSSEELRNLENLLEIESSSSEELRNLENLLEIESSSSEELEHLEHLLVIQSSNSGGLQNGDIVLEIERSNFEEPENVENLVIQNSNSEELENGKNHQENQNSKPEELEKVNNCQEIQSSSPDELVNAENLQENLG